MVFERGDAGGAGDRVELADFCVQVGDGCGVGEVDPHVAAAAARREDRVAALSEAPVHGRAQFS